MYMYTYLYIYAVTAAFQALETLKHDKSINTLRASLHHNRTKPKGCNWSKLSLIVKSFSPPLNAEASK